MVKKTWIILGALLLTALGAESGRRLIALRSSSTAVSSETSEATPSSAQEQVPIQAPTEPIVPPELLTKEAEIRALFAEAKHREALLLIQAELKNKARTDANAGYLEWLERQVHIIKTAEAWVFLEKQNCSAALTILEEIPEKVRPDIALKGIGYCKFLTRDWQEADSLLTRFLETRPLDPEAIQMLAKAKEAQGQYDEAIELTESLENIEATDVAEIEIEPLRKSLLAKQNESQNQLMRQGSFYTIHYQPNLDADYLDKVSETLQRTATKLNLDYGVAFPERSIDVFFHDSDRFGVITHGPEWAAGVYDGQIRLPVAEGSTFTEATARAIRHELTHALISEMVGRRNLPTWFQEGFAQLAECETFCMQFDYAATTQKFMPLDRFDRSFLDLSTKEAQVAYKQSHYMMILLVHYRKEADIKQMFSLLPQLESLSSTDIVAQTGWHLTGLYETSKKAWESQLSLKNLTAPQ